MITHLGAELNEIYKNNGTPYLINSIEKFIIEYDKNIIDNTLFKILYNDYVLNCKSFVCDIPYNIDTLLKYDLYRSFCVYINQYNIELIDKIMNIDNQNTLLCYLLSNSYGCDRDYIEALNIYFNIDEHDILQNIIKYCDEEMQEYSFVALFNIVSNILIIDDKEIDTVKNELIKFIIYLLRINNNSNDINFVLNILQKYDNNLYKMFPSYCSNSINILISGINNLFENEININGVKTLRAMLLHHEIGFIKYIKIKHIKILFDMDTNINEISNIYFNFIINELKDDELISCYNDIEYDSTRWDYITDFLDLTDEDDINIMLRKIMFDKFLNEYNKNSSEISFKYLLNISYYNDLYDYFKCNEYCEHYLDFVKNNTENINNYKNSCKNY